MRTWNSFARSPFVSSLFCDTGADDCEMGRLTTVQLIDWVRLLFAIVDVPELLEEWASFLPEQFRERGRTPHPGSEDE